MKAKHPKLSSLKPHLFSVFVIPWTSILGWLLWSELGPLMSINAAVVSQVCLSHLEVQQESTSLGGFLAEEAPKYSHL
jgi:hypothetical protein